MKIIQFFAAGEPKGQPRPRAFSRGGHARVYDPGTAEGWKSQIANCGKEHIPETPLAGPIQLRIEFFFPRPKSHYRKNGELKLGAPTWVEKKPDFDNAAKAACDALTILGFWRDDAQVVDARILKKYAHGAGYATGAMIHISEACL
jgi:Holliday junction resolvase RusA-like endonuclease